ncbi:GntR family transcriptional regulator [Micromonospora fulviviridis]|uniref:GntR family transcriptional regulator n=1 Tax=Micromonospora fulviviridis TaxID=47860 RepID=A0ABV2VU10_9ACTN
MPTPHYGQPRYRAIADELRVRIESGALPPGALLPPESALASEFRASRGTIRQAIAALREDELVTTEHGRGTYTNAAHFDRKRGANSEATQREVLADAELAALFDTEVGAVLIERQTVNRRGNSVETVTRAYQLSPVSQARAGAAQTSTEKAFRE